MRPKCYPCRPEWTWERWHKGLLRIPLKLQYYWSLTIRLFRVISKTHIVGGGLIPRQRCNRCILQPQLTRPRPCVYKQEGKNLTSSWIYPSNTSYSENERKRKNWQIPGLCLRAEKVVEHESDRYNRSWSLQKPEIMNIWTGDKNKEKRKKGLRPSSIIEIG